MTTASTASAHAVHHGMSAVCLTAAAWAMHVPVQRVSDCLDESCGTMLRLTSVRQQSAGLLQQLHCSVLGDQKPQGVQSQRLMYLLLHILSYLVACCGMVC